MAIVPEIERNAFHEAGHAVAALRYEWGVREVSIVPSPDGGSVGRCVRYNPMYPTGGAGSLTTVSTRDRDRIMIVSYAGYAAEVLRSPRHKRHARSRAGWDFGEARKAIRYCPGWEAEDWADLERRRMANARRLVSRLWPEISQVAAALLRGKALRKEDIDEIIPRPDRLSVLARCASRHPCIPTS